MALKQRESFCRNFINVTSCVDTWLEMFLVVHVAKPCAVAALSIPHFEKLHGR